MIGQAGEDAVRWMPGDEPVEYAPPVDADGQGDCNGANWRRTQKTAGELMKVSRRSTQRAAAVKNGPDLAPAVEHVTVADAYRIREEAANSRPGSDRGGVDIIATMPLTAQGRGRIAPTSAERTNPA